MMFHYHGKDYYIVDKKSIWNSISDEHQAFVRTMVETFDARVSMISADNHMFINRGKNR